MSTLLCVLGGCRQYLPETRYLQRRDAARLRSTSDARGKFDHERHRKILAREGVSCLDCHRFDVLFEDAEKERARELSWRALRPPGAACHACHGPSETKLAAAPGTCATCHENLAPLRPEDHVLAWRELHGRVAASEPGRCESCHRQAECADCHQRRDTIQTRVHDRNFRFFHGVEVRADPMQCGTCHRVDFCIRCHEQGGISTF